MPTHAPTSFVLSRPY